MLTLASGMVLGAAAAVAVWQAVRAGRRRVVHWVEMQLESH